MVKQIATRTAELAISSLLVSLFFIAIEWNILGWVSDRNRAA